MQTGTGNTKRLRAVALAKRFANPYYDSSDPRLWAGELAIIRRLIAAEAIEDGQRDELLQSRCYVMEINSYAMYWEWSLCRQPYYEPQYDGPVERLITRGIIRSVRCAGGYTRMIFTDRAKEVFDIS